MSKTVHELLAEARWHNRRARLAKGRPAGKAVASIGVDTGKKRPATPPYPPRGGYIRVQRPGTHEKPTLVRLLATGTHGITGVDRDGRPVKVRHEHVIEAHAQPTGAERADFAQALAAQGVPVSLDERFLKTNGRGEVKRRATAEQLQAIQLLAQHGAPLDGGRIAEHATYEEAQELIDRYMTTEPAKYQHPTDRFMRLDDDGLASRRPSAEQLAILQAMSGLGVPIDMQAVQEGAIDSDAAAIIERWGVDAELATKQISKENKSQGKVKKQ